MTLVEVLIAMGIIAAVAVTYMSATSTSSNMVLFSREQITAESLAKSQMEYVKRQPYDAISPVQYTKLDADDIPEGYDIVVTPVLQNPRGDAQATDDGIQLIIITITHHGEDIFTLEGYKSFTGQ
jgi:type II secretory pathway pseudopilin PulG